MRGLLRSKTTYTTIRDDVNTSDELTGIIQNVAGLLSLPAPVRLRIFEYAFTRTASERLIALHYGPGSNSAYGLMLSCKSIRRQVQPLYEADSIATLWTPHRGNSDDPTRQQLVRTWKGSRSYHRLKHSTQTVKHVSIRFHSIRDADLVSKQFIASKYLQRADFKPSELYIRVCICGALRILHENPACVASFCRALEMWAQSFSSLERIHVLYCGQQWPVWIQSLGDVPFPDIVFAQQHGQTEATSNLESKGVKSVTVCGEVGDKESDVDSTTATRTPRFSMLLDTELSVASGPVQVHYYDSWTLLQERCVMSKPPKES